MDCQSVHFDAPKDARIFHETFKATSTAMRLRAFQPQGATILCPAGQKIVALPPAHCPTDPIENIPNRAIGIPQPAKTDGLPIHPTFPPQSGCHTKSDGHAGRMPLPFPPCHAPGRQILLKNTCLPSPAPPGDPVLVFSSVNYPLSIFQYSPSLSIHD